MSKPLKTTYEIGYERWSAIDYFHDTTSNKYVDESKYTIKAIKYKEITDKDDQKLGLKDWLWKVKVYEREVNDEN